MTDLFDVDTHHKLELVVFSLTAANRHAPVQVQIRFPPETTLLGTRFEIER